MRHSKGGGRARILADGNAPAFGGRTAERFHRRAASCRECPASRCFAMSRFALHVGPRCCRRRPSAPFGPLREWHNAVSAISGSPSEIVRFPAGDTIGARAGSATLYRRQRPNRTGRKTGAAATWRRLPWLDGRSHRPGRISFANAVGPSIGPGPARLLRLHHGGEPVERDGGKGPCRSHSYGKRASRRYPWPILFASDEEHLPGHVASSSSVAGRSPGGSYTSQSRARADPLRRWRAADRPPSSTAPTRKPRSARGRARWQTRPAPAWRSIRSRSRPSDTIRPRRLCS